jgi:NADH:ubiquinone oxidoreductase subunit H
MFGNSPFMLLNNFILVTETLLISIIYIWVRATIPRIRYDHLIYLTWKRFLPVRIRILIIITSIIYLL